jgi:hypothetical protein
LPSARGSQEADFFFDQDGERVAEQQGRQAEESLHQSVPARRPYDGGRGGLGIERQRRLELPVAENRGGQGPSEQDGEGLDHRPALDQVRGRGPGPADGRVSEQFAKAFGAPWTLEHQQLRQARADDEKEKRHFPNSLVSEDARDEIAQADGEEQVEKNVGREHQRGPLRHGGVEKNPQPKPDEDEQHFHGGGDAQHHFNGEQVRGGDGIHLQFAQFERRAGGGHQQRNHLPIEEYQQQSPGERGFHQAQIRGIRHESRGGDRGEKPEAVPSETDDGGPGYAAARIKIPQRPPLCPENCTSLRHEGITTSRAFRSCDRCRRRGRRRLPRSWRLEVRPSSLRPPLSLH